MINRLLSGFIFMALLSGCGWDGTPTRSNDFSPLTSIAISADYSAIAAHTSTRLTATGNYAGLFSRDITSQVIWASDTPAVAGFNTPADPARVTGQSPGTAVLTATLGGVSSTFTLTVSPATVTSLTITPDNAALSKGTSRQFSVSGALSDGKNQDLTFDADWLSSAPAVATISTGPASKGLVQAVAEGTTTLTATFAFNGVSSSTLLTVTAPALQAITISPANPTMLSLAKTRFTATGSYSDGSNADITSQAVWSSTNTGIATVTTSGVAKTLTPGTVSISARLDGVSGTTSVKITGGILTGITISPLSLKLVRDTTSRISASGSFGNGSTRDITAAVDWAVTNAASATVTTPEGNLAWLKPVAVTSGTTVTAKAGSKSAESSLTVIAPQLVSIAIAPTVMELTAGSNDQLRVNALFNDGSRQDVTLDTLWTSDAAATAAVGNSGITKGRVSGVAAGPAIISATYGGFTAKSALTVRTRILRELTVTGTSSAGIGNQVAFTATAFYSDGTSKDVTDRTNWSIDKTNVATLADSVNQPGQIVMVDGGLATLTASFENQTKTVTLTSQGL